MLCEEYRQVGQAVEWVDYRHYSQGEVQRGVIRALGKRGADVLQEQWTKREGERPCGRYATVSFVKYKDMRKIDRKIFGYDEDCRLWDEEQSAQAQLKALKISLIADAYKVPKNMMGEESPTGAPFAYVGEEAIAGATEKAIREAQINGYRGLREELREGPFEEWNALVVRQRCEYLNGYPHSPENADLVARQQEELVKLQRTIEYLTGQTAGMEHALHHLETKSSRQKQEIEYLTEALEAKNAQIGRQQGELAELKNELRDLRANQVFALTDPIVIKSLHTPYDMTVRTLPTEPVYDLTVTDKPDYLEIKYRLRVGGEDPRLEEPKRCAQ